MNESWNVSVDNSSRTKTNWKCEELQLAQTEHKLTKYSSRSAKFKTMKKMATSDVGHEPRPYRVHVFPALVARRHGNRGHADFKVRGHVTMTSLWEWKTHDSTWAIPQSSRAHEQFVKTHEHFSNSWAIAEKPWAKFLVKTAHEDFKILMSPHEDSWGLMSSPWRLMSSSWGPHEEKIPRDFFL